jgi:HlyD family secretion protein
MPLALAGCGGTAAPATESAEEQARSVRVAVVEQRPLEIGISASGLLVPREEAAVGSELGGYRVAAVFAEEGDRVGRGQVLARLDPSLIQSEISRSQAQVAQAEANAARAQSEARRVAGLDRTGVLAQEQIEARRFEARAALAAVATARAQLRELQTRSERLALRSPVSGTIIERSIAAGAISGQGGAPLFRIARDSLIELAAEVPESELASVRSGTPVQVTLPGGEIILGAVRTILPRVSNENRLGIVRVRLPVRPDLRSGGTATARFGGTLRLVRAVPETAIQFSAQGATVMVVGNDNRARRVAVRPGQRAGGYVELIDGPPLGARVLMSGAAFVLDGDVVRPILGPPARPQQPQQQPQPAPQPAGNAQGGAAR